MCTSELSRRLAPGVFLLFLFFLVPLHLYSVEVSLEDSVESVRRQIDDDYLFMGETLSFEGAVESLYFFGKDLTMGGTARGNLISAAETLNFDGSVGDDTILAARTLNLSGTLGSTAFAAAETVNLFESAVAEGALFAAGNSVRIDGTVEGDLYVGARRLHISGRVDGDVRVGAERISIDPEAVISGDFIYDSASPLSAAEEERIAGEIRFKERTGEKPWYTEKKVPWLASWVLSLISLFSSLVFALLFFLVPGFRLDDTGRGHRRFWITVAWGLIPFFAYPVGIGALLLAGVFFGLTIPIAVTLFFSLGLLGYVLTAFALPQIGSYISLLFRWEVHERRGLHVRTLLGFVPVLILGMIPVVRGLLFVLVLSLGWGVALERLFEVHLGEG